MAHPPDGAGKRRYWEEAVARRCDDEWREACIKFDKGWSKKQHEMEAASHWTSNVLGTTVYATARSCLVDVQRAGNDRLRDCSGMPGCRKSRHASLGRSGAP